MCVLKPKNPKKGDQFIHIVFNEIWEWNGAKWVVEKS